MLSVRLSSGDKYKIRYLVYPYNSLPTFVWPLYEHGNSLFLFNQNTDKDEEKFKKIESIENFAVVIPIITSNEKKNSTFINQKWDDIIAYAISADDFIVCRKDEFIKTMSERFDSGDLPIKGLKLYFLLKFIERDIDALQQLVNCLSNKMITPLESKIIDSEMMYFGSNIKRFRFKDEKRLLNNLITSQYKLLNSIQYEITSESRVSGKVRKFDKKKGYGFIKLADDRDVFFHYSQLAMEGFKSIEEGIDVELDLENDGKALKIVSITTSKN